MQAFNAGNILHTNCRTSITPEQALPISDYSTQTYDALNAATDGSAHDPRCGLQQLDDKSSMRLLRTYIPRDSFAARRQPANLAVSRTTARNRVVSMVAHNRETSWRRKRSGKRPCETACFSVDLVEPRYTVPESSGSPAAEWGRCTRTTSQGSGRHRRRRRKSSLQA